MAIVVPNDNGSKLIIDALTSGFKQPHQKPWVKGPTITFGLGDRSEDHPNHFESYNNSLGYPMTMSEYDRYINGLRGIPPTKIQSSTSAVSQKHGPIKAPTTFRVLGIAGSTLDQLELYVPLNMYSLVEGQHYGIRGLETNDIYRDFMRKWPLPYTQRRVMCTIAGVFGEIRNLLIVPPDIMRAIKIIDNDFRLVYKAPPAKMARVKSTYAYVDAVSTVYRQVTRGTKAELSASRTDKTAAYATLILELRCMK